MIDKMMFISTKTLSGETFIAYMEDFPFVTHASWTLSYDCDTVKKIIFLCSLRVLVYNERISVQPSIRSERMFVSFFSFSQNEWLEFQLHTDKRLSVFKCLSMRLWGVWLYALRLTLSGKSSHRITPTLTFDPIRSDQSCPGRVRELGEHRRGSLTVDVIMTDSRIALPSSPVTGHLAAWNRHEY